MRTSTTRRQWLQQAGAAGLCAAGVGAAALPKVAAAETGSRRPPNIVVIFADDLGYGDLGCYGAEQIKTPRLDAMAAEGMRFTDFYVCSPVCSPSRAGLLTGRHPVRMGIGGVFFPASRNGMDTEEITMADVLGRQGYATACIGKWHLGHLPEYLPTRRGFDEYFGIPYSNDMDIEERGMPPIPLMRGEEVIEQPVDQTTLTTRYTEEAIRFIEANRERPFFLYLPHTMPHVPLYVSERFAGRSEAGLYGDVIEEMDWSTGAILDALKENGLDDNTLVIFTSDNGPWLTYGDHGGSSGPLRMGKGSTFDGGVRVPCIARWPGRIEPGAVERTPAWTVDFLPSFAALAGAALQKDRVYDGHDIVPLLEGSGSVPERDLIFHEGTRITAIRRGRWKYKREYNSRIYGEPVEHPALLFNLEEDIGETDNLIEQHPDIAAELEGRLKAFEESIAQGG
jgi:arylsulfatase A